MANVVGGKGRTPGCNDSSDQHISDLNRSAGLTTLGCDASSRICGVVIEIHDSILKVLV